MTVKTYIQIKGFKHLQIAKDAFINASLFSKFLNGWEPLPKKHLENLSKVLGVSQEEIINNKIEVLEVQDGKNKKK